MNALAERLGRLIAHEGPITLAQYMAIASHERALGFYGGEHDPLGSKGDFVTAPEISQMFGELLFVWCMGQWRKQGSPGTARLVELGPGRGTMMSDVLRAAKTAPDFLAAIDVVLVESHPALRTQQETRLAATGVPISWTEDLKPEVFDRPVFVLANEFFDSLPVRQFLRAEEGWRERMVGIDASGALDLVISPIAADAFVPGDRRGDLPGSIAEISDSAKALSSILAQGIAEQGGAALIIDYGNAAPAGAPTLQAIRAHRPARLLEDPGEVDLSAHVDFGVLAASARQEGAAVFGPVTQGQFLESLGIRARAEVLSLGRAAEVAGSLSRDVERLIGSQEMGELFKVMAILPPGASPPTGFG